VPRLALGRVSFTRISVAVYNFYSHSAKLTKNATSIATVSTRNGIIIIRLLRSREIPARFMIMIYLANRLHRPVP
jgi:hypothetical protein